MLSSSPQSAAPAASHHPQPKTPLELILEGIDLLVRQRIADVVSATTPSPGTSFPKPNKVWLSIHDIQIHYGIGRKAICQMIHSGKLAAKDERCRGGKLGKFVHISDAEKVLMRRDSRD